MDHVHRPRNPLELHPPPLRSTAGYVPLWNGQGKAVVGFYLLEQAIHWYGIHFIDGRARPCLQAVGPCEPCRQCWTPRRTGFVCAMRGGTGGRYVLRVTDYAYRQCPVLALVGVPLRGTPLLVCRRGETKQAPWVLAVPTSAPRVDLPPAPDTIGVLSKVWGIDLKRVGESPPPDGDVTPLLQPYQTYQRRQQ